MDEAQFFCSGEHVIGDRNLRALEDVVLRMPELIASITRRLGSELESQSKRPRVEPEVRPAVAPAQPMPTGLSRVIGGALSLSQDEWKKVEKTFAVIAERRRGTPAVSKSA